MDFVHVSKGGFLDVGYPEAREDSLQLDQERFQVDYEEGGQRVPLADGEEDGEDRRYVMEKKRGRGLTMKSGNPASYTAADYFILTAMKKDAPLRLPKYPVHKGCCHRQLIYCRCSCHR